MPFATFPDSFEAQYTFTYQTKSPISNKGEGIYRVAHIDGKLILIRSEGADQSALVVDDKAMFTTDGRNYNNYSTGFNSSILANTLILPYNPAKLTILTAIGSEPHSPHGSPVAANARILYSVPAKPEQQRDCYFEADGPDVSVLSLGINESTYADFRYRGYKSYGALRLPTTIEATYSNIQFKDGRQLSVPTSTYTYTLVNVVRDGLNHSDYEIEKFVKPGAIVSCFLDGKDFGVLYDPDDGRFESQVAKEEKDWANRVRYERRSTSPVVFLALVAAGIFGVLALVWMFRLQGRKKISV